MSAAATDSSEAARSASASRRASSTAASGSWKEKSEAEGDRHRAADAGVEEAVDLGALAGQGHDQERRDGGLVDQHLAAVEEQRDRHHQGDEDGHLDRADADQVDDRGGEADADGDADRELDRAPARLAAREAERDDRGGGGEERLRLADDQLRQRPGDPGGDGGLQDRQPGAGDRRRRTRAAPRTRCSRAQSRDDISASVPGARRSHPGDPLQPRGALCRGRVRDSLREADIDPRKGVHDVAEAEAPAPIAGHDRRPGGAGRRARRHRLRGRADQRQLDPEAVDRRRQAEEADADRLPDQRQQARRSAAGETGDAHLLGGRPQPGRPGQRDPQPRLRRRRDHRGRGGRRGQRDLPDRRQQLRQRRGPQQRRHLAARSRATRRRTSRPPTRTRSKSTPKTKRAPTRTATST